MGTQLATGNGLWSNNYHTKYHTQYSQLVTKNSKKLTSIRVQKANRVQFIMTINQ